MTGDGTGSGPRSGSDGKPGPWWRTFVVGLGVGVLLAGLAIVGFLLLVVALFEFMLGGP